MKAIADGTAGGAQWNNTLLDDLAFIKKKQRYPLSRKTIPSTILIAFFVLMISRLSFVGLLLNHKSNIAMSVFTVVIMTVVFISGILSYWRTLRFSCITTPYFESENRALIELFLKSQHLNMYRHPKAPEVFQILSRALGNKQDQREVMIFIADDHRILINSHFINQKWTITPQSRNYRKMASQFKQWLTINGLHHSAPEGAVAVTEPM